jgi:hypothetical protein
VNHLFLSFRKNGSAPPHARIRLSRQFKCARTFHIPQWLSVHSHFNTSFVDARRGLSYQPHHAEEGLAKPSFAIPANRQIF